MCVLLLTHWWQTGPHPIRFGSGFVEHFALLHVPAILVVEAAAAPVSARVLHDQSHLPGCAVEPPARHHHVEEIHTTHQEEITRLVFCPERGYCARPEFVVSLHVGTHTHLSCRWLTVVVFPNQVIPYQLLPNTGTWPSRVRSEKARHWHSTNSGRFRKEACHV